MEKFSDYEYIEEDMMLKHAVTRIKGHVVLWWYELQAEHKRNGK